MPVPIPMPVIPVSGRDIQHPFLVVVLSLIISAVVTGLVYFILERKR